MSFIDTVDTYCNFVFIVGGAAYFLYLAYKTPKAKGQSRRTYNSRSYDDSRPTMEEEMAAHGQSEYNKTVNYQTTGAYVDFTQPY